ncbi:hypothetical protein H4582DRAFT_2051482 [Lactarius indigo]|nr:hypothetical protein H4582DRAFT_2051482 [Lactarius indigo]
MSTPLHSRLTYYPDKVSIRGIAFYERTAEAACLGNGLPRPDMLTLRKLEESDPYQMTPEMRAATAACSRASHRWLNCPTCCLSSRPPSPWCRSRDESVLGRRMSSPSTGKASACRGNHRTSAWCSAADGPKQDLKIESLEKQRGVAVRYLNTVYEAMFGRSKSRMEGSGDAGQGPTLESPNTQSLPRDVQQETAASGRVDMMRNLTVMEGPVEPRTLVEEDNDDDAFTGMDGGGKAWYAFPDDAGPSPLASPLPYLYGSPDPAEFLNALSSESPGNTSTRLQFLQLLRAASRPESGPPPPDVPPEPD